MLNYGNLNDVEFEALCCDVMSRMLGVSLRRFGPGRDGGVDLTDDVEYKSIIVQIKHYRTSSVDMLIRSLKKELPKVEELDPQRYYICCSKELSPSKVNELYRCFHEYMESDRNIITILEIDDYLNRPENRDILKKHFKLWIDSTGILEELSNDRIFVDCEALLSDADAMHKLFVRTAAFDRALKALEDNHTLCIIGDPGVGKSITSKMLVLYYATQGYRVRYTSDVTDLTALKASLRREPEAKEVILLDDCFGQAYFDMKTSQSSELVSLIKYVKVHRSKILILNSRITIFQEAQNRHRELGQSLEREEFKVFILDMSKLSDVEKAKIFYNHLAVSCIPDEYFEDIRRSYRYRIIITHRNYNPRVIEFVCNPNRYRTVAANHFYEFVRKHLDNPSEMWADEYDDRLRPEDRILLQTVYSLTTTSVSEELVRQCFNRRIESMPAIDKTIDQFSRSLKRLNEGFIKILDNRGEKEISMRNPSVNDFLNGRFRSGSVERADLLCSICAIDQLRLLPVADRIPYTVKLIQTGKIERFIFLHPEDKTAVISHCILVSNLCLEQYRSAFLEYIMNHCYSSLFKSAFFSGITVKDYLLSPEIWEFYNLKEFFEGSNHLYSFLSMWDLGEGAKFINACDSYFQGENYDGFIQQVEHYLTEAIDNFCNVDASDYEAKVDVEKAIRQATSIDADGGGIDEDDAASILENDIQKEVYKDLRAIILGLPPYFAYLADDLDMRDIDVEGAEWMVQDYLSDTPGHHESDDDPSDDDEYSPMDAIFQR